MAGLAVRSWRAGDALRPVGLGGRKKVQDLFVDRKVPRAARHRIPLVVDAQDRVLWVPGHALDEACRAAGDGGDVVVLKLTPQRGGP
jgi:tRNA(Ile)-lysidine synthase